MIKMVDSIPTAYRTNRSGTERDIREFVESGNAVCVVTEHGYNTPMSAYFGYLYVVRRRGYPVNVLRRGDTIYLQRKDV